MIIHNGIQYRRDPKGYLRDSKNRQLHRVIWEEHHGPIPDGHLIHHVDGDPGNNAVSNLQKLKTNKEHMARHFPATKKFCVYCDAPFIDRSVDKRGRYCSEKCGKKYRRGFKPTEKNCEVCGAPFTDRSSRQHGRFCSQNCRAKHRRGFKHTEKTCEYCGALFTDRGFRQHARFCSSKCRQAHAYRHRCLTPR